MPGNTWARKLLDRVASSFIGIFAPLPSDDDRFESKQLSAATLEELTAGDPPIVWPTVRSGNLKGNLAMYVSVDAQGRVQEAWRLNSDNAGLDDPAC